MKLFADILFTYCICFRYIYLGVNTIFVNQVRGISYYLSETKRDIKHHLKTRMTTFIKMKFKISDDQTNIYKYRLAGNITEFSKGINSTQQCPPFSCCSSPDSLKLGFRCTRSLVVRILWPISRLVSFAHS